MDEKNISDYQDPSILPEGSHASRLFQLLKEMGLTHVHIEHNFANSHPRYGAGLRFSIYIPIGYDGSAFGRDPLIFHQNISDVESINPGSGSEFLFNEKGEFLGLEILV